MRGVIMDDKVMFERVVLDQSGSLRVTIPKELANYLDLEHASKVTICGDNGKHGRFISMWKKGK